jgi:hypothetical protein
MAPRRDRIAPPHGESGQAALLLLGVMAALLVGALFLGSWGLALGSRGKHQRAADLAAVSAARAMADVYPRLFEPPVLPDGAPNPPRSHRRAARIPVRARATAELAPDGGPSLPSSAGGGGYHGPLAYRQGKPMRPDVARAFDRMAAAARRDGTYLIVVSGYRSDAEQARLFAAHPDPKWVAPPGKSLHRLGTELDLGPPAAYGWLAANAKRFGFIQRYSWERWH